MPELPEVETIRLGLARRVRGRTVVGVEVGHPRAVRRQDGGAEQFAAQLLGRTFGSVDRRGKYLWLPLSDSTGIGEPGEPAADRDQPATALLVHLGMSGQLLVHAPGRDDAASTGAAPANPHLRVRLRLDDGSQVWFVDQRTFGHVMVTDLVPTPDGLPAGGVGVVEGSDVGTDPVVAMSGAPWLPGPVAHIARDLLDPHLDLAGLVRATRARRTEIKRALLDQSLVSGIGNIYADETLWRAKLHGRRATDALAPARLRNLYAHGAALLREAVAVGGTSFDALYVDVDGASGYFERELNAYGRAGLPCRRCGRPMRREQFMNRSSFSCTSCQRIH